MALETERKYLGVDFGRLRLALAAAGAEDLGAHFESNVVYDTPELSLWGAGKLLRVRSQEWPGRTCHVLTLKLPAPTAGVFKAREERELHVESAAVMGAVLTGLGFGAAARYEKVRSVWRLAQDVPGGAPMLVELDELPFARVVELEGPPEALDAVAALLGLDKHEISTKSYHALHQEWRSAQGLPPERSFVFGPEERRALRRRLGLPDEAAACF
ncbi:class IV adenylate cyclase [Desulfovibrio sp.]|uniref:class IV adenylate cyclase n=1 Tax=Desulfovibrio sp. TaxID=885 RepID=UPI0023C32B30|nr:class IV adenylate cyclase [Desulfovibrio sp.]MDE7241243.1 class IV adenylate cyclase [Desulfovibrio sp.]